MSTRQESNAEVPVIIDADTLGQRLADQLDGRVALPRPQARMSLAYGRHRGPAPRGTRVAAVVVALYRSGAHDWIIPLTVRPRTLQHHGGQISLPGGRIEPGEDAYAAALREFHEELGIEPKVVRRCGQLSTQYVYASANLVYPVVTMITPPEQQWRPDPIEVEEVVELPLGVLLDPRYRVRPTRQLTLQRDEGPVGTVTMETPAINYQGHRIWGATALILDQLAQVLRRVT